MKSFEENFKRDMNDQIELLTDATLTGRLNFEEYKVKTARRDAMLFTLQVFDAHMNKWMENGV